MKRTIFHTRPALLLLAFLLGVGGSPRATAQSSRILPIVDATPGARSFAMGQTSLGLATEMHLYNNPAALLFSDDESSFQVGVSGELFPKTDVGRLGQYNLATSYKLGDRRAILLGARYEGGYTIPLGEGEQPLKPYEYMVDFGYTFAVTRHVAVYGTGSYFNTAVGSNAQGVAFGVGVAYHNRFNLIGSEEETLLTLGVKLQDAGTAVRFDNKGLRRSLPTSVLLGGDVVHRFVEVHQLTIAATARYYTPKEAKMWVLAGGIEYDYNNLLQLRAGYRHTTAEQAQFTCGIGGKWAGIQLNAGYALSLRPQTTPNVLSLSLGYQF